MGTFKEVLKKHVQVDVLNFQEKIQEHNKGEIDSRVRKIY